MYTWLINCGWPTFDAMMIAGLDTALVLCGFGGGDWSFCELFLGGFGGGWAGIPGVSGSFLFGRFVWPTSPVLCTWLEWTAHYSYELRVCVIIVCLPFVLLHDELHFNTTVSLAKLYNGACDTRPVKAVKLCYLLLPFLSLIVPPGPMPMLFAMQ